MNIDSIVYQNGLLILLVGSFFLFIVCVFCIGAFADCGLCCHEHPDIHALRIERLHTRYLFEQTCINVPNMLQHIADIHVDERESKISNTSSDKGLVMNDHNNLINHTNENEIGEDFIIFTEN